MSLRQILHHGALPTRTASLTDDDDANWDIQFWSQREETIDIPHFESTSLGVIATAALCILEDHQKAKLLCLEGYMEILSQLRRIPPLATEARRAVIATVPLIREVEALAESRGKQNNSKQLIMEVPSIRHVLGTDHDIMQALRTNEIWDPSAKQWEFSESESIRWGFDPISSSDLCIVRLSALIDFAKTWRIEGEG